MGKIIGNDLCKNDNTLNQVVEDQYMDLKSLKIYSGIPISTLRHYLKNQGMPSFKAPGKIYIKRSEFDNWMEQFRLNSSVNLSALVEEVLGNLN